MQCLKFIVVIKLTVNTRIVYFDLLHKAKNAMSNLVFILFYLYYFVQGRDYADSLSAV